MTTDEIDALVARLGRLNPWSENDWPEICKRAASALTSLKAERDRLEKELSSVERELDAAEEDGCRSDDELGKLEARAETAERELDEARAEVERMKKQREELVIHITCTLAQYKALGWIEDDVPPNIEQAYAETFHLPRAALTKVLTTVRAEARKAALEEAVKLADERGAATTASAIRALIEKEG